MNRESEKCEACPCIEPLADHRGRLLCYDCWHAARERETPFVVMRYHTATDYDVTERSFKPRARVPFQFGDVCYLREEAEARAAEIRGRESGQTFYEYVAEPVANWSGDRLTHPAYMARRRGAVLAEHPENALPKGPP